MENFKLLCLALGLMLYNGIIAQNNNSIDFTLSSGIAIPYSNFGQNTYKNGAYANTGLTFNIESDYHFMRWNYYLGRQGYYIGAAAVTSIAYTKNPFNTKKYVENQLTYMGKHLMSLETEAKGYQLLDLMIGIKLKAIYKRSTYPYFKCMFGAIHIVKGAMQTNGKTTDDEGITIDYFDYKIKKQTSTGFAMLLGTGVKRKLNQSLSINFDVDLFYSPGHNFIIEPSPESQLTESIDIINLLFSFGLT